MAKKVKINGNRKLSINKKRHEFLRPDFIYIPLIAHNNTHCEVLFEVGSKVNKGAIIGRRVSDNFPIITSVSGVITGIIDMMYMNGKMVKTVVIKNDFKEKISKVNTLNRDISKITKEEFLLRLKKHGVSGQSGNDFSTYLKYETNNKLNTLLVNGVECEPYLTADYIMMKDHCEEILETTDAIITIMDLERAIIAIREDMKDIKQQFDLIAGTYPNIEIVMVKDYYPIGWEHQLINDVLRLKYSGSPLDDGVVVDNVSTIYAIYQALRYNKPLTEKYVTITGDAIKTPQNVLVKIGSRIDEVIESIGGYKETKNPVVIANGPMMGKALNNPLMAVVKPLNGIIVNKYTKEEETECTNCGKCVDVCPVNLAPALIINNKNVKELKKLRCEKCIHCGLCSYICPAKIDVREKVIAANDEVLK